MQSRRALKFIVLLGVVSLFADVTYEGARSAAGPFLAMLGASALIVSLVSGGGELVGYTLRLWSGRLADRMQRYWAITFVGYAINLLAVPLLAPAGNWPLAAGLLVLGLAKRCARPRGTRCSPTRPRARGGAGASGRTKRSIRSAPPWVHS